MTHKYNPFKPNHKTLILYFIFALLGCNKAAIDLNKTEYSGEFLLNCVVHIFVQQDTSVIPRASGFLIRDDGLVATADHVIYDENRQEVYSPLYCLRYSETDEKEVFPIRIVKRFREKTFGKDLAILRIEVDDSAKVFPYVDIEGTCEAGDPILVAGFPKVFKSPRKPPLLRRGIISSTRYNYDKGIKALVMDLTPVSGYSGSPVVNLKTGKVIGVYKGHPRKQEISDFSIATVISKEDFISMNSDESRERVGQQ